MMIKPVSVLAITIVGMMSVFPSNGAPMTSQIQRLLDQKEEKIKQLEECEGKKQGWMIAGISTIGLTAVGVGVNIAQASKSNKLSGEIEQSKQELERQQEKLSRIESNITKKGNGNSKADEADVCMIDNLWVEFVDADDEYVGGIVWTCEWKDGKSVAEEKETDKGRRRYYHTVPVPCDAVCVASKEGIESISMSAKEWDAIPVE